MVVIVIFLTVLIIGYIYVFEPGQYDSYLPVGISDFRDKSSYKIEPETILASIDRGEMQVFKQTAIAQQNPPEETNPWQQADFIKVTRALNQFVWEEPLSGWRLYSMHFSTPCKDNLSGFAESDFYYFKTTFRDNG